jgi:aromatic ring-opening dioxygenase LigB subunit
MYIGSLILPHGAITLDPTNCNPKLTKQENTSCEQLNQSIQLASKKLKEMNPDIIILSTPHGISLENDFGIYMNQKAKGNAEWLGEYSQFEVSVTLESEVANQLKQYLKDRECNVQGISSFTVSEPAILRWGEVIPLWFIQKELDENVKYVIMSQPMRRMNMNSLIDELLVIGKGMYHFCQEHESVRDKRVAVVISGDLAHTHASDGPYGLSECAQKFDSIIEQWVQTQKSDLLIDSALQVVTDAKSCGYSGLVMLDGLLKEANDSYESVLLSNLHPTYFGMLVAYFQNR